MATKPVKVLAHSLLWTGIVIYANNFIRTIAPGKAALVFGDREDLFADYIKLVASYPAQVAVKIETWLPAQLSQIISNYLATVSYGNDPSLIHQQLTHFGLPPLAQIFYVFSRHLIGSVGAMTGMIFSLAAGVLWLTWCAGQAMQKRDERLLFIAYSMLIYPSLFLLARGNIASLYSSLAVSSAFLLALQPARPAAWPILMLSLATGLRPNNIIYLPLLAFISSQARPKLGRLQMLILYGGVMAVSMALFFLVLHWIYPAFTLERFIASYKWIAQNYDTSPENVRDISSPLQITNALLVKALGPLRAESVLPLLRTALLSSGLAICLCSFVLRFRERVSIPTSILLCTAGMILASPWFVNYHLLILIAPLLCWAAIEQSSPVSGMPSTGFGTGRLSRLDCITIIILLVPKPFALFSLPNLGALVNPLILATYSYLLIWRHRKEIFAFHLRRQA
jgi:hypothetical protein